MIQRMEMFERLVHSATMNGWNERVDEWKPGGTVRAALSVASGNTAEQNSVLRIDSTHRALTMDIVRTGERIRKDEDTYIVDYVIEGTRYRQLFLTKVDKLHGGDGG